MNGFKITITLVSVCLVILASSYNITKIFAQNSNIALPSKVDNGSSVFLFVYTVSGGLFPIDKRISFDSFNNDLVTINNYPEQTYQIKTLDNSTIENLKKIVRDNNLFSVNNVYYTQAFDIPVERLLVILDGKVISTELNKHGSITEQIPIELVNFIHSIRNATLPP
jgi:hypothetical protein